MPTHPGFHPDFDIAEYPNVIWPSIRKISANFYVTRHFHPIQVGNSTYYAVLVRPTDEFSIYINADREILIVFSLYKTFEIRTLEAYDEFYSLLESKRIDKSLRFLISEDDNIEFIIRHYLDQHPEYPIIIPITFTQINNTLGNALLGAVRRNYLLRDLFGYQNPLREETFFFGRQTLVNSVLDMAKSGQNSSLFGLRKSGKTSVIYAIQRRSRNFSCNVAVIDCQSPAIHARRYDGLLAHIIAEIRRSLGLKKVPIALGTSLPEVSENFTNYMNSITISLKNTVLVVFDEIENISPNTAASPHWRQDNDAIYFWQIIRSYIQSEGNGKISVCIIGTSPHILETAKINGIANPIYLYAQKKFIPNLSFEETKEMIERLGYFMGLEFSTDVISELHREFGGHPFFTRQVCSKIHQLSSTSRPVRVSKAALQRARADFSGDLEGYLREIIEQLRQDYPEEFEILKAVVNGNIDELSEYGREAPDLIDHLIGYGMVDKIGNDFDIRFEAVKSVLQHLISTKSDEDRWAEISRRRNVLESNIRVALYHWSRGIPSEEWHSILESTLTNKRREALSSTEPHHLFSSTHSPLYLTDLLMLIKDEMVLPFLRHRRSLIVQQLDTVNKLRKDAHALKVTEEDLRLVCSAFEVLEAEFSAP